MSELQAPVLDVEKLQKAADLAATNAALKEIADYYEGYNSPYRKQIKAHLEKTQPSFALELPDIIAQTNKGLAAEVDKIANSAVAKSFIPLVNQFLTRVPSEMLFSDILKAIVSETSLQSLTYEDYSIDMRKDSQFGWYDIYLKVGENNYKMTLHESKYGRKDTDFVYQFLSLPNNSSSYSQTMKVSLDGGATVELPFTPNVLQDSIIRYFARLVMCKTYISLDVTDFDESMFDN